MAETLATIRDDAEQSHVIASFELYVTWRRWHPTYVLAEIERMLPELRKRWPTKEERKQREFERRRRARLRADAAAIVRTIGTERVKEHVVRRKLGLSLARFAGLIVRLGSIGAVRLCDDGCLIATASAEYASARIVR